MKIDRRGLFGGMIGALIAPIAVKAALVKPIVPTAEMPKVTLDRSIEIQRCASDPAYFIKNYMYVSHPCGESTVLFDLQPAHENLIYGFVHHRKICLNKARQIGASTLIAGYILWISMYGPTDHYSLIVNDKFRNAIANLDIIRFAYDRLPDYMRSGLVTNNPSHLKFENGSCIVARAMSPNAGLGTSLNLLYVDEVGFSNDEKAKTFYQNVRPSMATSVSSIIMASTPGKPRGLFYDIWTKASDVYGKRDFVSGDPRDINFAKYHLAGSNGFVALKAPWYSNKAITKDRAEIFKSRLGEQRFAQEFDCQFVDV